MIHPLIFIKCKLYLAVYRSAHNNKDEHPKTNDPTTLKKEWPTTNRYAVHNHKLKGFRVRLDFAEKDFIELDQ